MSRHRNKALRFNIGDQIWSKVHGYGVITAVNKRDPRFCYNATFRDGTLLWYDGRGTVKA